jgi:hypothetical protein
MDPAFVKKEAKWYEASKPYDNLSRLPPASFSASNPGYRQAIYNHYTKTTNKGPENKLKCEDYADAWPQYQKRPKRKKKEPTPEDSDAPELPTAGIPPKDRDEFNAELRSFMQENCPSDVVDLPNPINTKASKAEKAKKAIISKEKRAAAKARSTMAPAPHTRNTRLRATQAVEADAAPNGQTQDGDVTAIQNATAAVAEPEAEEVTGGRQQSAPPCISLMRDTRAAMAQNAYMSRPVHGFASDRHSAALDTTNNNSKPSAEGGEPIGNDILPTRANTQEPSASKPDASTTTAPKKPAVQKKSTAKKAVASNTPAPEKSADPKPAAPKPAAPKESADPKPAPPKESADPKPAPSKESADPKPAPPKESAATPVAIGKAASSTKSANNKPGKDKSSAVKLPRAAKACDPCRAHKTRCTGGTPCDCCRRRGFTCVFAPEGRKAPVKRAREDTQDLVKNEPPSNYVEQESRPAKRARKLKGTLTEKASDSGAGTTSAQTSSALPSLQEAPEHIALDGQNATKKRAREGDEEGVKHPLQKDAEQESRPAKRTRKLKAIPTEKQSASVAGATSAQTSSALPSLEEAPEHITLGGQNATKKRAREAEDTEQEGRPAKRPLKLKLNFTRKSSTNESHRGTETTINQPASILPSIEEVPEDNVGLDLQTSKMQHFSQPKVGENAVVKPTKVPSSYSGRVTRSRSRQLSEEADAQTAKLQKKGKKAQEDTEEPQERPAELQRSKRKGPNSRQSHGHPGVLRAIESKLIDSEGSALTDEPWDNYPYDPTWMSNTYTNWFISYGYPDLMLRTQEESFHTRPSIKLVITDVLKGILVDDWEHVTKDSQLVPLPHEQPVIKILNDYLEDEMPKREQDSPQMDILKETMAGLREYFDRALGRILLYR